MNLNFEGVDPSNGGLIMKTHGDKMVGKNNKDPDLNWHRAANIEQCAEKWKWGIPPQTYHFELGGSSFTTGFGGETPDFHLI